MEINIVDLREKIKDLFDNKYFEEIIELLSDEIFKKVGNEAAEFYIWRGNASYERQNYDKAIDDYNKAIDINKDYTLAYYNRAFAFIGKNDYDKAISDYDTIIKCDPDFRVSAYVIKGSILRARKEYEEAIKCYNQAIDIDDCYANAYFNRGIAKKEYKDLIGSKYDFEKFIELTEDKNDKWVKFANHYIEEINELNDKELSVIIDIIGKIKDKLLVNEDCITHYTSLSVLKSLIIDNTKFRLSEGNFMNDPTEGKVFFNFLDYKPYITCKEGFRSENFSPKPFIGSFVTKDKHNDLNMWRFYGKENGIEAKGCAVTLRTEEFIKNINNSLPKGEEDFLKFESDIHFYRVVYLESETIKFHIPNLNNSDSLSELMFELKDKVASYKKNRTSLEKYLNSIAFLFKSDAYKNENEVRLVVKGLEFEKKYNIDVTPPKVYIELESIKKVVDQITLGPKVDKAREWAAVFHYIYEINAPEIIISHLPYQ